MDVMSVQNPTGRQVCLSLILKAIRRRRGLRSSEVARQMGIALRSYQRFESGAKGLEAPFARGCFNNFHKRGTQMP
jgi:DNA-binding transcriptional regulator YiaG